MKENTMRKDPPPAKQPNMMTIDEAVEKLQLIAATSPLGGDTVFCVCVQDIEYQPVTEIKLDADQDGGVAIAMIDLDLDALGPTNEELAS